MVAGANVFANGGVMTELIGSKYHPIGLGAKPNQDLFSTVQPNRSGAESIVQWSPPNRGQGPNAYFIALWRRGCRVAHQLASGVSANWVY